MDSIKKDVLNYLNSEVNIEKLSYTESLNQENYNAYKTNLQRIIQDINVTIIKDSQYQVRAIFTNICPDVNKIGNLILENKNNLMERATINIKFFTRFEIPQSGGANKKTKRRTKKSKRTKRKHSRK